MFVSLHETGDCRRLADSNVTGHFATESHIFTLDKGFLAGFFFWLNPSFLPLMPNVYPHTPEW